MKRKYDPNNVIISLVLLLVLAEYFPEAMEGNSTIKRRIKRADYERCSFDCFFQRHTSHDPIVSNLLRMSLASFHRLVSLLSDVLIVDESYAARRGGAISPQYCVFMTLRYLAGA
jgi:hypothetical protein